MTGVTSSNAFNPPITSALRAPRPANGRARDISVGVCLVLNITRTPHRLYSVATDATLDATHAS